MLHCHSFAYDAGFAELECSQPFPSAHSPLRNEDFDDTEDDPMPDLAIS